MFVRYKKYVEHARLTCGWRSQLYSYSVALRLIRPVLILSDGTGGSTRGFAFPILRKSHGAYGAVAFKGRRSCQAFIDQPFQSLRNDMEESESQRFASAKGGGFPRRSWLEQKRIDQTTIEARTRHAHRRT
jgi:hypothetical protein